MSIYILSGEGDKQAAFDGFAQINDGTTQGHIQWCDLLICESSNNVV